MKKSSLLFILFIAATVLIIGCSTKDSETLSKELLFSIPIGKTEDQLSFFQVEERSIRQKIRLFMKDGLFYIGNGSAHKIMKFNSYGDILSLYYNEQKNPQPVLLSTQNSNETVSNRAAYPYPFNEVGEIAVTPDRELLVQDSVPRERGEYDKELNVMLDQVILRFNRQGEYIDYIGQEGIGGTPFPFIVRLEVTSQGDIIVFSKTMKSRIIYWYNKNGVHLYTIHIHFDKLPAPDLEGVIPNLDTVFSDPDHKKLYVKLDYYVSKIDQATKSQSGIDYHSSRIYTLDIESEEYVNFIEIPKHYIDQDELDILEIEKEESLYDFIGVASGGYFYLLTPDEGSYYELLIIDNERRVVKRTKIILKDSELLYRSFYLAPSGILTAILCEEEQARVVWWRSDRLLEQEREEEKET
jgi:hypothetical protein